MNRSKLLKILVVLVVFGLIIFFPGRKLARAHVNSKTAVEDHPLTCTSCHLYTRRNGAFSKLTNADYYSPFNIAVSKDGRRLFVVAQDKNMLLEVDCEKGKGTK